jgi:hypothetical protein
VGTGTQAFPMFSQDPQMKIGIVLAVSIQGFSQ